MGTVLSFKEWVSEDEIEDCLRIAAFAAEALYGADVVQRRLFCYYDPSRNAVLIGEDKVNRDVGIIFKHFMVETYAENCCSGETSTEIVPLVKKAGSRFKAFRSCRGHSFLTRRE